MEKKEQLYEGKAKKVFATRGSGSLVIVDYKDDATAFNGEKKGTIVGKGVINNRNVQLHHEAAAQAGRRSDPSGRGARAIVKPLVKKVSIVPLEVIVSNM